MSELETEEQRTRTEIANFLHDLADQLDAGGEVTIDVGGNEVTFDPSEPIAFKLEGESDWAGGATEAKQNIEFELVWRREAQTADEGALDVTPTGV